MTYQQDRNHYELPYPQFTYHPAQHAPNHNFPNQNVGFPHQFHHGQQYTAPNNILLDSHNHRPLQNINVYNEAPHNYTAPAIGFGQTSFIHPHHEQSYHHHGQYYGHHGQFYDHNGQFYDRSYQSSHDPGRLSASGQVNEALNRPIFSLSSENCADDNLEMYGAYGTTIQANNYPSPALRDANSSPYTSSYTFNGSEVGFQPLETDFHPSLEQSHQSSPNEQHDSEEELEVESNHPDPDTPTTPSMAGHSSTLSVLSTVATPSEIPQNDTEESDNEISSPDPATQHMPTVVPRPQRREKNMNSKLQKRLRSKPGPVGDNRQLMGHFKRVNNEYGMWRERGGKSVAQRATYHSDVRAALIALDEANNQPYVEPPAAGLAEHDITSRNNFNSSWTSNRTTVRDRRGNQVLLMDQEPDYFATARPTNMIFRHAVYGPLIVIDHNNHPVRHWRDVPRVISSEIEAWRIEALQRTVGVAIPDIRARMPRVCQNKAGTLYRVQGPTALTNRTARWRKKEGVTAWRRNGKRRMAQ